MKAFADDQINVTEDLKCALEMEEKPAFSPFPTMLSKGLFHRGVISRDCVVKGEPITAQCHILTQ